MLGIACVTSYGLADSVKENELLSLKDCIKFLSKSGWGSPVTWEKIFDYVSEFSFSLGNI